MKEIVYLMTKLVWCLEKTYRIDCLELSLVYFQWTGSVLGTGWKYRLVHQRKRVIVLRLVRCTRNPLNVKTGKKKKEKKNIPWPSYDSLLQKPPRYTVSCNLLYSITTSLYIISTGENKTQPHVCCPMTFLYEFTPHTTSTFCCHKSDWPANLCE